MTDEPGVSPAEWHVWRAVSRMRRQLDLALEHQLQQDAGISRTEYEILVALHEAENSRLRARELGGLIGWEKSRVSHQVTRMEQRGLVRRSGCDTDMRGTWIELTDDGRRATIEATRDHAASIRRYFFDVLTDDETALLGDISGRVLEAIDPPELCDGADDSSAADTSEHVSMPVEFA